MHKRNLILHVLVFFILLCATVQGAEYREFVDRKWGYKLDYPATYNARSIPHSKDLVKGDFTSRDRSAGVQVRIYPNPSKDFKTFCTQYVAKFQKDLTNRWKGDMKVVSQDYKKIGPYDGFVVTYDFTRGDKSRYFLKHHLWDRGSQVYLFQSGCPYDKKGIHEKHMDTMADTLRFLSD